MAKIGMGHRQPRIGRQVESTNRRIGATGGIGARQVPGNRRAEATAPRRWPQPMAIASTARAPHGRELRPNAESTTDAPRRSTSARPPDRAPTASAHPPTSPGTCGPPARVPVGPPTPWRQMPADPASGWPRSSWRDSLLRRPARRWPSRRAPRRTRRYPSGRRPPCLRAAPAPCTATSRARFLRRSTAPRASARAWTATRRGRCDPAAFSPDQNRAA